MTHKYYVTYKPIRYSDHADRERRTENISRADVRRTIIAGDVVPSDGTGYPSAVASRRMGER